MLKEKTGNTKTMQCWLKMVIAAALLINLLIFARLLMPDAACNSQQAIGNHEVRNKQGTFRIIQPAVNFMQLIIELYKNKPSM
jgi:hypothetical protein